MNRPLRLPALGVAAVVALVLAASCANAEDLQARIQSLLDGFRDDYGFPGATAAISLPNGEVVTAATGHADVEAEKSMSPETRMLAASIGKSFLGAMVLALEAEGILQRGERLSDHLGDRNWFARLPNHATMTIDDLLRHRAGLPDHVQMESFQSHMALHVARGGTALDPEEVVAFLFDAEPLFPAGTGWAYTDTGYLLLGLLIEKATGRDYFDLVAERFLDPLGLAATTPSRGLAVPGLAVGYASQGNPFGLPSRTMNTDGSLRWDPAVEWTGGGFASTSRDLALWGHALFGGTAMAEPYLDRLLDAVPVSPDASDILYGAGISIYAKTPRGPVYGHGGWIPGYVSSLRHYAQSGVTVAFQINSDVGIDGDSADLVPSLEAALADLAVRRRLTADDAPVTARLSGTGSP